MQRAIAVAAQATAQAEADIRTTAEAIAVQERKTAEEQTQIAFSRELAAAALLSLDDDPERSILLAMQALSAYHTAEAERALHRAIQASRVR